MKKAMKIGALLLGICLLQQALNLLGKTVCEEEREVIDTNNLDPSLFFYTDSDHALQAEQNVRQQLNSLQVSE